MIEPFIPTRNDFRIVQGSLGVSLTVLGPLGGSVVVNDTREAEAAIVTLIEDAREVAEHQIDLMRTGQVFF